MALSSLRLVDTSVPVGATSDDLTEILTFVVLQGRKGDKGGFAKVKGRYWRVASQLHRQRQLQSLVGEGPS